jgi:hypothetical protein
VYPLQNEIGRILIIIISSSVLYHLICFIVYIPQPIADILNEGLKTQDFEKIEKAK